MCHLPLKINKFTIALLIASCATSIRSNAIEFNTDILNAEDKDNIDFTRFSKAGYIVPGGYHLALKINSRIVRELDFNFYERDSEVEVCLTKEIIPLLGLKPVFLEKISWWHENQCADLSTLPGTSVKGNLSESMLTIAVPQAYLEYQDSNWIPPSQWEDGIPGVMLDYNINTTMSKYQQGGSSRNVSGTGSAGANAGPWRFRADWQGTYNYSDNLSSGGSNIDWTRFYAYRALPNFAARLMLGEDYLSSDLFDSWRYTGATMTSDERMLPPKLRGYAPEVTGIAKTNAKVIISQQGRIIYESTVASGPFRIQELNDSVKGRLDVRVEEQDGSVQTFQVDTASVPYLTRPGQLRYKLTAGRPSDFDHHIEGPAFSTGEFSWGVSNAWSLYGGAILAGNYNAFAGGIGRDLLALGTISADVTQSIAKFSDQGNYQGKSWRLSYSKRFEEFNSEVTFAGYRFSERNYLSMGEYLSLRLNQINMGKNKELYTVTANKSFPEIGLSAHVSWSHQTYWDQNDNDRYNVALSRYFNIGNWKNIAASLNASRSEYNNKKDDAVYLNLSIPIDIGSLSYSGMSSGNSYSQTVGWYERLRNGDSYRLQAGNKIGGEQGNTTQANGYYNHNGDYANMNANISWAQNSYTSAGITISGGMTATAEGAAIHPGGARGNTRMMVSTGDVSDVPIINSGRTNLFGVTVVQDIPSYYLNKTSIDVSRLPDDIDALNSPVAESALTEGAIGFKQFDVIKGSKMVGRIRLNDGTYPPFGASVFNDKNRELGIISDEGLTWLIGTNPEEELVVRWGGKDQCHIRIPEINIGEQPLLPCVQK